jgi:hypothetical protein
VKVGATSPSGRPTITRRISIGMRRESLITVAVHAGIMERVTTATIIGVTRRGTVFFWVGSRAALSGTTAEFSVTTAGMALSGVPALALGLGR